MWSGRTSVLEALRKEPPAYRRGTIAYQAIAFGWILSEALRCVTGETLDAFSAREFGADLRWRYDGDAAETYRLGASRYMLKGANLAARCEETNNRIAARTALVTGAGMYATARALAAFYARLGCATTHQPSSALHPGTVPRSWTRSPAPTSSSAAASPSAGVGPTPYGWWNTQRCSATPAASPS